MNKEFIPYEQALALKELGFDEPCLAFYSPKKELHPVFQEPSKGPYFNNGSFTETLRAPLYQQVFRWFREKHSLIAYPVWRIDNTWDMNIQKLDNNGLLSGQSALAIIKKPTYEEAESACLDKLIEICKTKNNEQAN